MYEFAGTFDDLGSSTKFVTIAETGLLENPLLKLVLVVIMVSDAPAVTVPDTFVLRVAHSAAVMLTQSPILDSS
jgi:hypothetical protein